MNARHKVTIIGTGYVGLTTGAALAFLGHEVRCVDRNPRIVERLRAGDPILHEGGLADLLAAARANLSFSVDLPALTDQGIVIIAVGTPSKDNGEADLSYVDGAARDLAAAIRPKADLVVVNKSTVPIGSAQHVESLVHRALRERGVEATVRVASNPEFLAEGQAVHDSLFPDRIVIGASHSETVARLRELYAPILEQTFEPLPSVPRPERYPLPPLVTTTTTSAELAKYAANSFLATKISFINEFATLADRVGADVTQVARAIGLDPRIGPRFLQAGIGWGGSCFGKDTRAIMATARTYGLGMPIVEAAVAVNYEQRMRVVDRLQDHLKVLRGTTVGILGLAFKSHTRDLRDAPSLTVIQALEERGATVRAHDPVAGDDFKAGFPEFETEVVASVDDLPANCDALVIATDWPEYRLLDFATAAEKMRGSLVLDARNLLDPEAVRAAGLTYLGVGRGDVLPIPG